MINLKYISIGVFFSKTCDYVHYTNDKGIRIVLNGKNKFWDIYLYPKIYIYKCEW